MSQQPGYVQTVVSHQPAAVVMTTQQPGYIVTTQPAVVMTHQPGIFIFLSFLF